MAANLQQMAAAGQLIPQQQQQQQGRPNQAQLSNLVYRNLMANTLALQGWQTAVQISERMGKTLNLITNVMLAMPSAEWQRAASFGLEFEKDAFHNSPDKSNYDQKMNAKNAEMFKKRQANEQNLHSTLNAQAAAAQAAQQQQQQMLLNQQNAAALQGQMGRGMGQPGQQGFQHLQHPMQVSQIPQQPPQMAMNMGNPGAPQMGPNQPGFQMPMNGMRQPGGGNNPPVDLASLSPQDKQKVAEFANKLAATTPDAQKANMRVLLQGKLTPQQAHEFRTQNRDPLMWYFQQQAFMHLKNQAQMMRQQQQGMPPNPQAAMMQQQSQQRTMNPNMMNALNQAGGMAGGNLGPFSNMESIMNEQKQGYMAQEAGQIVVPANSGGPGGRATPQPMGGMPQNMPPNPNQTPRQPQMQQPFNMQQAQMKMDQAAAQSQAQIRAQAAAKQLQGQPGGLGGPMPASQSPAMNTLNAPVRRPPVPMGQMDGQQMGQPNAQFGGMLDPRFNQQRAQISMGGNINANSPAVNAMLAAMPVEQRQKFSGLPPERLNELMNKWQEQQQQRAMQMNNAAQAVKNQPQMPVRPGQPQPGQGQFNPANPNPQFQMANGMQQPNANIPPNLQQAYIQQQIARARMTGAPDAGQAAIIMDSMDVPPQILTQFNQQFGGSLPAEIKKWKDFKTWLASNPGVPDNIKHGLLRTQQNQFRQMMQKRNNATPNAGNQPGMIPPNPQQAPGPMVNQQPNNMPPNMPQIPPHMLQVTPQDIQTLRQQHPRLSQASDDAIRRVALKIKTDQINKAMAAKQNGGVPVPPPQQQPGQMPQPAVTQAQVEAAQVVQPGPNQPAMQKMPPNNAPPAAPNANAAAARNNNRQAQQNQAAAPNPSPATAQKNLKRPNPDEADGQAQANAAAQRPASQQNQRPAGQGQPMPTPEQLAKMTPEQRQKFEQMMKARQMAPEDMNRLKVLAQEESATFGKQSYSDIAMQPAEKQEVSAKITRIAADMAKLGRAIGKWYAIARDENRTRLFFRHRLRLLAQFQDGEKMQALKDTFSISSRELDQIRGVLETMTKDLAAFYGKPMGRPNQAGAPGQAQAPAQQGQPPAPQPQQTGAQANKMHQRSNSKSGQAPAAPTSAQPPFAFGASSPHGQPSYVGKPTVTQENLQLPPPKKARKNGPQANASPSVSAATASPHVKPPSPEAKRQQVPPPPKPLFVCPEPDCDSHNTGFATEEARQAHIDQEHIKPYQEPFKFFEENLAVSLGLDSEGHSKTPPKSSGQDGSQQLFAPSMTTTLSKQGQTPMIKPDLAATPMSRAASMNRQPSATKANEIAKSTPGKAVGKIENTPKIVEVPQVQLLDDPWAGSTIDPQNLFAQFNFDPAAGGVISDLSLYRSVTPNDTPESSKDSGVSEPNSDISEGAALEIDMNYQFGETGLLLDMDSFNIEGSIDPEALMMNDPSFSNVPPLDYTMDFDKPFSLDMSLYSMDTT